VQFVRPLFRSTHETTLAYATVNRFGQVDGVPDKNALAALKETKRKLDELYREVTSRNARATLIAE
jgi:hypothetical protein